MRYTQEAMDALKEARQNNPNMSQRRLAYNIFMLIGLGQVKSDTYSPTVATTLELFNLLNSPTEVALQHLIRGIDRQIRAEAWIAREQTARNNATSNQGRKPRSPNGRKSRARQTAGMGSVRRI